MEKYKKLKKHIADFYGVSVKALDPVQKDPIGLDARITLIMILHCFTCKNTKQIAEITDRSAIGVYKLLLNGWEKLKTDHKFYKQYADCVDIITDLNLI